MCLSLIILEVQGSFEPEHSFTMFVQELEPSFTGDAWRNRSVLALHVVCNATDEITDSTRQNILPINMLIASRAGQLELVMNSTASFKL